MTHLNDSNPRLDNYEYSSAMVSIILAYYLNEDSDIAIRKTARKVRKRLKSQSIKNIMTYIAQSSEPTKYLNSRIQVIQEVYPIQKFLELGLQSDPIEYRIKGEP